MEINWMQDSPESRSHTTSISIHSIHRIQTGIPVSCSIFSNNKQLDFLLISYFISMVLELILYVNTNKSNIIGMYTYSTYVTSISFWTFILKILLNYVNPFLNFTSKLLVLKGLSCENKMVPEVCNKEFQVTFKCLKY